MEHLSSSQNELTIRRRFSVIILLLLLFLLLPLRAKAQSTDAAPTDRTLISTWIGQGDNVTESLRIHLIDGAISI